MNSKFENFKKDIKNKKIDVIGIGISNTPLIKFLAENGASVCACDRRSKDALGDTYNELQKLGVQFCLGDEYLDHLSGDIIFKTPGLRFDNPALLKAAENGARRHSLRHRQGKSHDLLRARQRPRHAGAPV